MTQKTKLSGACRCIRESPITKDTNLHSHRHPFHPLKPRIEWLPVLTKTTSFSRVFFQPLPFSRKHPSFSAHRAVLMTKTDLDLTFKSSIFFKIDSSAFDVNFHSTRSDFPVKFGSGVIFLDQSDNSFATHSNQ